MSWLGYRSHKRLYPSLTLQVTISSPDQVLLQQSMRSIRTFLPQLIPQTISHSTTPDYIARRRWWTFLRSPHVYKSAREQWERREHQAHCQVKVYEHFARFEEAGVFRVVKLIDKWLPYGVKAVVRVKSKQHLHCRKFARKIDVKNIVRKVLV
eukprot:TRINITY_DN481_c0_g1_i1.p1 TRINITY_DN481_c0_g1~~TRINITY_DN481_c0_g1_i1.p1  ORF type:complete len:153 (-),score=14.97 TRINITY_DN481_c0_g1_i1:70-528(-)